MRKQAVKQAIGNNEMESALEILGKNIARWTDKNDRFVTAIPGLTLSRRNEPAYEHHVRTAHLRDRPI